MIDMEYLKIRKLQWIHCSDGTYHDENCQYEIEQQGKYWLVTKGVTGGGSYVCTASSVCSAFEEAQRFHEQRIMEQLMVFSDPEVTKMALHHAIELEQCSIFAADVSHHIAKSMTDAATFLRELIVTESKP